MPTDTDMSDIYTNNGTLLTIKLSPRAHARYEQSLWYAWGRDDAGDHTLRDAPSSHYLGNDFAFAEYAAVEAESFERQHRCMLSSIGDQYRAFVATLNS